MNTYSVGAALALLLGVPITNAVYASCEVALSEEWTPFFTPRISAEALLERLNLQSKSQVKVVESLQINGAQIKVQASAFRYKGKISIYVEKEYDSQTQAIEALKTLRLLMRLEKEKMLGGFNVATPIVAEYGTLKRKLIEGRDLSYLIKTYRSDPRLKGLYQRYISYLDAAHKSLQASDYVSEMHQGELMIHKFDQFGQESLRLHVGPENVIVEADSGKMFIIDRPMETEVVEN